MKVARRLGPIVEIEDPWRERMLQRSFLRAKVSFDTLKPLPTGCWLRVGESKYKSGLGVNRAIPLTFAEREHVKEFPKHGGTKTDSDSEGDEGARLMRRKSWIAGSGNNSKNTREMNTEGSSQIRDTGTEVQDSKT
ncbi:hypothetical protein PIB30_003565 [Stylosanthes scabra]|uniref:Uncharacterized protein n=1 Tax=Stylosanthes scabra TaxID=79078 RepID=A0ABU6X1C5_9FABA|nr:hypothetical protein [Stylosanthes scabra]